MTLPSANGNVNPDLGIAQQMIRSGATVFVGWPSEWQRSLPDESVIGHWNPGQEIHVRTGMAFDVVDFDPLNFRRDEKPSELLEAIRGCAVGIALTKSGGWHAYVPKLGLGSKMGFLPGIDLLSDGHCAHIPPMRGQGKDGTIRDYKWIMPLDVGRLSAYGVLHASWKLADIISSGRHSKLAGNGSGGEFAQRGENNLIVAFSKMAMDAGLFTNQAEWQRSLLAMNAALDHPDDPERLLRSCLRPGLWGNPIVPASGWPALASEAGLPFTDISDIPDSDYRVLVVNRLWIRQFSLWHGAGGVGKSFFMIDGAIRVALGLPWLGADTQQSHVIYVYTESKTRLLGRLKAACAGLAISLDELKGKITFLTGPRSLNDELLTEIYERGQATSAGLVVLDNMTSMAAGRDLSNQKDMQPIYTKLVALGDFLHVAMLMHDNKAGEYFGSMVSDAVAETRVHMKKGNLICRYATEKSRDIFPFSGAYVLQGTPVGRDQFGNPVESAFVREPTMAELSADNEPEEQPWHQAVEDFMEDNPQASDTAVGKALEETLGVSARSIRRYAGSVRKQPGR